MVANNISPLRSLRFSAVYRDCTKVGNHLKPLNLTSCPTMLTLHCMGLRAQLSTMREQENCKTPLLAGYRDKSSSQPLCHYYYPFCYCLKKLTAAISLLSLAHDVMANFTEDFVSFRDRHLD